MIKKIEIISGNDYNSSIIRKINEIIDHLNGEDIDEVNFCDAKVRHALETLKTMVEAKRQERIKEGNFYDDAERMGYESACDNCIELINKMMK